MIGPRAPTFLSAARRSSRQAPRWSRRTGAPARGAGGCSSPSPEIARCAAPEHDFPEHRPGRVVYGFVGRARPRHSAQTRATQRQANAGKKRSEHGHRARDPCAHSEFIVGRPAAHHRRNRSKLAGGCPSTKRWMFAGPPKEYDCRAHRRIRPSRSVVRTPTPPPAQP